uniref:acetyl-CoA carboxylase carboxyltransferase beta subunit n=1 Tax=Roridula gorgonias TaxID=3772 RepID=UPI0022A6A8D0|nr:acetyl-CoA carboxylase carboxyltransferase beta subunit [Roridula gorgonias]UZT27650.1 acetyl-CoA carboxylase carboxyltransferase beta subunit [Roridula gorgonias]
MQCKIKKRFVMLNTRSQSLNSRDKNVPNCSHSYICSPVCDESVNSSETETSSIATLDCSLLWAQCEFCDELNYKRFLKAKMNVCEECGSHLKMNSVERIEFLIDSGTWDPMNEKIVSMDPIEFDEFDEEEDEEGKIQYDEEGNIQYHEEKPYKDHIDFYPSSHPEFTDKEGDEDENTEDREYFSCCEIPRSYPSSHPGFTDKKGDEDEKKEDKPSEEQNQGLTDDEVNFFKKLLEEWEKDENKEDKPSEEQDEDEKKDENKEDKPSEEEEKSYKDRIDSYQRETGLTEAVQTGTGQLNGIPVAIGIMDFFFIGGSMGSAVGEKITRLVEYATNKFLPLIIVCASGGARMQEGSLSLMQMAKISSALYDYQVKKKLFYVSILSHPTTGGVTASFGMLGDVIIAEPNACIAFAGKRVIEETLNIIVPEGLQETEYLFEKGLFDLIIPRNPLKNVLSELFQFHAFFPLNESCG